MKPSKTIALVWLVCVIIWAKAFVPSHTFPATFRHDKETKLHTSDEDQCENFHTNCYETNRRDMLISLSCLVTAISPVPSLAADGFDDGKTPMLGLSRQVRKSAVQGAQIIDKIDSKWERFSDDFGLGEQRNKPKVDKLNQVVVSGHVTPKNDLNENLASAMLQEIDVAFLKCLNAQQTKKLFSAREISSRVDTVKKLVQKSFFPSPDYIATPREQFNYEAYTRFKAYNDILIEQNVVFPPFYAEFQSLVGSRLIELIGTSQQSAPLALSSRQIEDKLQDAFKTTDVISTLLIENGFISSWERSVPSPEDLEDFTEPYFAPNGDNFSVTSDLQFTLALVGDVTLRSQILLQELGYRLYPSFGRWALQQSLQACFAGTEGNNKKKEDVVVIIDDYYMDTAYNSNPELFEVKQIMLNIVLQRT